MSWEARIVATYAIVDRVQGGKELLDKHNIEYESNVKY